MIQITNGLWIGNNDDERSGNLDAIGIKAVLNTAHDLIGFRGWPHIEYAQVGIIDGPGNLPIAYISAALCIAILMERHNVILVYDHSAIRSLLAGITYLNLKEGQHRSSPTSWGYWPNFNERLEMVEQKIGLKLPRPHEAHEEVFNKIPWGLIAPLV